MKTLQIVVTEKCNFGCSYCYMNNKDTYMTLETFMGFYESLSLFDEYRLDFFGGEPLMNWDVVKSILEIVGSDERFKEISLPSNGTLLTEDIVNDLLKYRVKFSWSFDGLTDKHNKQYTEKIDLIRRLTGIVSPTIHPTDLDLVGSYNHITSTYNVIPNYKVVREGWTAESTKQFIDSYTELVSTIIENFNNGDLRVPYNIVKDVIAMFSYTKTGDRMQRCIDGELICLMPDGTTGFCARMCTNGIHSAPTDFDDYYSVCGECEISGICKKGCYHIITETGIDDNLCSIYKHMYAEAIRLNHALKDNAAWRMKYMKRIFYESERNV